MYDVRPDQRTIEGNFDRASRVRKVNMGFSKKHALGFFFLSVIALAGCEELVPQDPASLLIPRLHRSEIIGLVAGFGTTFAAVPDLIAMLRRRSSTGMNPRMAAIMGVFQILWVYYGLLIVSRPVVVWNIIAVATNFFSVGAYLYFARRERSS
jgi:uncharacterized protein with PQ loop repeat